TPPFILYLHPTNRTTLYPYTTLFRSNKLIQEEHSLFGTSVELDKFFRIIAQDIKKKDKSNYNKNLEKFARKTGLVIRNNAFAIRSEEHTSELQSRFDLVCGLLLEEIK